MRYAYVLLWLGSSLPVGNQESLLIVMRKGLRRRGIPLSHRLNVPSSIRAVCPRSRAKRANQNAVSATVKNPDTPGVSYSVHLLNGVREVLSWDNRWWICFGKQVSHPMLLGTSPSVRVESDRPRDGRAITMMALRYSVYDHHHLHLR